MIRIFLLRTLLSGIMLQHSIPAFGFNQATFAMVSDAAFFNLISYTQLFGSNFSLYLDFLQLHYLMLFPFFNFNLAFLMPIFLLGVQEFLGHLDQYLWSSNYLCLNLASSIPGCPAFFMLKLLLLIQPQSDIGFFSFSQLLFLLTFFAYCQIIN